MAFLVTSDRADQTARLVRVVTGGWKSNAVVHCASVVLYSILED